MSATDNSMSKRPSAGHAVDQGESKKAAVGDNGCSSDAYKHPPTRRGIICDIMVEDADKFVGYMTKAAGSKEYFRSAGDNGKILHLALDVDGVATYVEELGNNMDTKTITTPHVRLHLNCDDPVAVSEKMMKAGAKELSKCEKQFWGAKYGHYQDPFGQIWSVSDSTNTLEDVPKALERRIIPFVSVRDATAYMTFLSDAFGAEPVYPAAKDPSGKVMCAELKVNGGLIMVGDHCGHEAGKEGSSVTISYEVEEGRAGPLSKSFEAAGGEIMQEPTMAFWGQVWGRCKDAFGQAWGICEEQKGPPPSDEEMAIDMKIGAKYDWKYTWSVEEVPKMHCFGERRTCLAKGPAIKEEIKTMLPAAFGGLGKAGIAPTGPLVAAYFTWDPAGETTFTCGPTVAADGPPAEGDGLGVRAFGDVKCVTVVHMGPYTDLMTTYEATFEWIEAKGYENRMPVMEVYENNPEEVEPAKVRTKICIPIVPKGTPKA